MIKITKRDMNRAKLETNFGLDDSYTEIIETVIDIIKNEKFLQTTDIKTAIELCMLDLKVSNASFHDNLKPYYSEHHDLIPVVGIEELMNMAVEDYIKKQMLHENMVDSIGSALMFDYMKAQAEEDAHYSVDIFKWATAVTPIDYYDTIEDMYEDVNSMLDIAKIDKPEPVKVEKSNRVHVIVLDDASMADDILALIKLMNGGN